MVLIMRALIFLVLSRFGLAWRVSKIWKISKYQYITGCKIAVFDTWHNNCHSGKAKTET